MSSNLDAVKQDPFYESGDDLAKKELEEEFKRNKQLKDQLHLIFRISLYIAFGGFIIVFSARLSHLIIPKGWSWLTEDQIQGIDKIFFSGAIGGVLGGYLRGRINNQ